MPAWLMARLLPAAYFWNACYSGLPGYGMPEDKPSPCFPLPGFSCGFRLLYVFSWPCLPLSCLILASRSDSVN